MKNKKEAWDYYKLWMKEKTYCKVLKCEVKITNKGWDHLNRGSKTKRRKVKDKINRFQLLKIAKYIIKNAKSFRNETRDGEKYYILNMIQKNSEVRVLIKEDKNRNKYFYSVMKH